MTTTDQKKISDMRLQCDYRSRIRSMQKSTEGDRERWREKKYMSGLFRLRLELRNNSNEPGLVSIIKQLAGNLKMGESYQS